jgi:uncharacterized protein YdaU (DUF1376 family)
MAKVDIWMPIYIGDYLRDTEELSDKEHGAYLLLLMHYWLKRGEIGCDIDRLARVAKTDSITARFILGSYFTLIDGNYKNKRADVEMRNANSRRLAATENGKKGGRPAHNNPQETGGLSVGIPAGEPAGVPKRNPRKSSSSSSSSSSSPLRKREREYKNNSNEHAEALPPLELVKPSKDVAIPDPLYQAIFQSFIAQAGAFTNYPKEAQAIKRIIKYCEQHAPRYADGDKIKLAEKVIIKYHELTQNGERFWRGQPFTPSSLSASGIFDRVLVEIGQTQEERATDGIPF